MSTITGGVSVAGAASSSTVTVDGGFQYADGSTPTDAWSATLSGSSDYSDQIGTDGTFHIQAGANQTYNLSFEQYNPAYTSANYPQDGVADIYAITPVSPGATNTSVGNWTVPNATLVQVVVQNETGAPIQNAHIQIRHENNGSSAFASATTNANGELVLDTNDQTGVELTGAVDFAVYGPAGYGFNQTATTVTDNTTLTITLPTVATVDGTLSEPDGTAAANDSVLFERGSTGELVTTDSNGNFSVDLTPGQTYEWAYYQGQIDTPAPADGIPDFHTLGPVTADSGTTTLSGETLPSARNLTVNVVREDGTNVSGAMVTFSQAITVDGTSVRAGDDRTTNQDGLARIEVDGARTTDISVHAPSGSDLGSSHTETTADSDNDVTVVLKEEVFVNGTVSASNGISVENASVGIHGINGTTGAPSGILESDGSYAIPANTNGTYEVYFQQTNWQASAGHPKDGLADLAPIGVVETSTTDVDLGQFSVPKGHLVNVTVVDSSGTPVEGVDIIVEAKDADSVAESGEGATTNADGELVLDTATSPGVEAPNGTLGVYVSPADATLSDNNTEILVDGNRSVTLTLQEQSLVTGSVTALDGTPVSGKQVLLHGESGGSNVTTDTGTFTLGAEQDISYELGFRDFNQDEAIADYERNGIVDIYTMDNVSVESSETNVGDYRLPVAHAVNITVVNQSGAPVSGAPVYVQHVNGSADSGEYGHTDSNGMFVWDDASHVGAELNGTIGVHVEPGGSKWVDNDTEFTVTENGSYQIVVQEQREFTGRLVGPDGTPVSGAEVVVNTGGDFNYARSDAGGNFSIGLPTNETASLGIIESPNDEFTEIGQQDGVADVVKVTEFDTTGTTALGNLSVPVGHQTTIRAVDRYGNPVPNAPMLLRAVDALDDSAAWGWNDRTDADGYLRAKSNDYELNGTVKIVPDAPDGYTSVTGNETITVDSNQTHTFVFERQGEVVSVNGSITDADGNAIEGNVISDNEPERKGHLSEIQSDGSFTVDVETNESFAIGYTQRDENGIGPRDGIADVYPFETVDVTSDTVIGSYTAPQGHVLNVTVENQTGAPIEGASVMFQPEGNEAFNPITAPAVTNTDGKAVVGNTTGLEATGPVFVYATRLGQTYDTATVTVTSPTEVTLTVPDPERVTVDGRILDSAGNPAVNDTLTVYSNEVYTYNDPIASETVTDTTGQFSTTAAANVTQELRYFQGNLGDRNAGNQTFFPTDDTPDVFAVQTLDGTGDAQLGDITLPQAYHVEIEVVTPNGTPVEGATVDVTHQSSSSDADARYDGAETNANGRYEIPASDGTGIDLVGSVVFGVSGPNGEYARNDTTITQNQTVTIELDVDQQSVPLSLAANATTIPAGEDVRFTVTDDANDPVNESNVTVTLPDGSTQTVQTDANGEAVFTSTTTGDYAVTASKNDTATEAYQSDSLTVTANEPGHVVVESVDVPSEVVRGEDVTVDITLSNPGAFDATDTLDVTGPLGVDTTETTLTPGETRTVVRTISTQGTTADTLSLTAETSNNSVSNTSTILEPANVSVDGYSLVETTILANEPVNATATLNNTGEVEGTYVLNLSVDGSVVTNETVTVGPQTTKTVNIATLVAWESDGTHTVSVADRPSTSITVLRPTNPDASVTVTAPTDGDVIGSGTVTLTYDLSNVTTGINHTEYSVDGGAYQTLTDGLSTTSHTLSVADGDHDVSVRLVDNLGTVVATSNRSFAVDSAAPVVGISAAQTDAIGVSNPTTVSIESTDANPGTTTFAVTNASGPVSERAVTDEVADGTATISWNGSLASGTALASGTYTLEVTSTDAAGNANTTTQTVSVDNDAPTVTATGVTDGTETTTVYVNDSDTLTISGTASDAESTLSSVDAVVSSDSTVFEERFDATLNGDGTWSATVAVDKLPDDGTYTVGGVATDAANNEDSSLNSSLTVVVDREAPSVGAAILNVTSNEGVVNVTANEVLATAPDVTVIKPGGANESVTLTQTASGWNGTFAYDGDGEYRLVANATDRAGNTGTAEATAQVQTDIQTVDKTVVLTNGQSGTFIELHTKTDVNEAFGALTESDTPVGELSKKLSGSQFIKGELGDKLDQNLSYALVGIPVDKSQLAQGVTPQDVDIRYFNETTKEWELVGTTTVETLNVTGTPTEYYVVNVSHFSTYGAVAPDTTAPSIDDSALSGSGSPYDYSTDTVDVTFDYSDAQSGINTSNVTVALDGTDVTGDYAGDLQVTSSSTTLTAVDLVGSGSHEVTLTVTDEAGNKQTTTKSFTVEEDETAPSLDTSFTDGKTYAYGTDSVSFDLTYSDTESGVDTSGVTVEFTDSSGTTDVTAPATVTSSGVSYTATDLTAGTYTIEVNVPDGAGNDNTTTKTFTIDGDDAKPTIESVTQSPSPTSGSLLPTTTEQVKTSVDYTDSESGVDASAITVEFDDGSGFTDVTDQAVITSSQANYTALDLGPGAYTVRVTVVDADGNTRVSDQSFTIGTGTAPQITGSSLTPTASGSTLPAGTSQATITVSYDDAEDDVDTSAITATFDGSDVTSDLSFDESAGEITYQATGLTDGSSYTLSVDVVDSASNSDSTSVTFDVDESSDDSFTGGSDSSSPSSNYDDDDDSSSSPSSQSETTVTTTPEPTSTDQPADEQTDGESDTTTDDSSETESESTPDSEAQTATTTAESTAEEAADGTQTTDSEAPGFGLTTMLGALILVLALVRRRL
ncbi:hypothetical protein GJR96_07205 [Haloferax sp. MBLA0076]|uniref:Big-1 domain-containing protein n=1 Tax=Haloferax litoreum TaxID=2666140 RepID=A0A6A8GGX3_9EURY|nr:MULTISPECIES: carboxypeptidase-like regulatory domain-containing protein [Haloferax]KAB1193243.1 hypothetical protein Hfx1148_07200 [Haloferax sp. CBA1148]MRX21742.1 hypothetical protein [Haloferax litoreum]